MKRLNFICLLVLMCSALLVNFAYCQEEVVIADFEDEDISDWNYTALRWDTDLHKPVADETKSPLLLSVNDNPAYVKADDMSLKIVYQRTPGVGPLYAEITKRTMPNPTEETDTLSFWIYSDKDEGVVLKIFLIDTNTWKNMCYILNLDFKGWKKIAIHKDQFPSRPELKWTDLNRLQFVIDGAPFEGYIDDLKFTTWKK